MISLKYIKDWIISVFIILFSKEFGKGCVMCKVGCGLDVNLSLFCSLWCMVEDSILWFLCFGVRLMVGFNKKYIFLLSFFW